MQAFSRPLLKVGMVLPLVAVIASLSFFYVGYRAQAHTRATQATLHHKILNCSSGTYLCADVAESDTLFGHYVGHDEPSLLFYSNKPGSGNNVQYQLALPKDPSRQNPLAPGKAFEFMLNPTFWLGMALCDSQSYPEQVHTCTPDSDKNIVDPSVSPNHPSMAFMELQFYPPGSPFSSCDAASWCAAIAIFSDASDPVSGTILNPTCAAVTGQEYANYAFITKNGKPQPNSPPNPVQSNVQTFTPDPNADLFMRSGDQLSVTMHDTANGLSIGVNDHTTGQNGSMTASAANNFGQVQYDPTGTSCNLLPYNFHPMYSTSSEKTSVTWAAHTGNIAFTPEIGHFDSCVGSNSFTPATACPAGNTEGNGAGTEPTDADDSNCYPTPAAPLIQIPGCDDPQSTNGNFGFDGASYQNDWPDGNTKLHPTSELVTGPLTGTGYQSRFSRIAFESNIPGLEFGNATNTCSIRDGSGCTIIPQTDDPTTTTPGQPATFYPFFSIRNVSGTCAWQFGNRIPGTTNDFRQSSEYGTLSQSTFTTPGGPITRYENFRQILPNNPC